jgi:hypothetical protein
MGAGSASALGKWSTPDRPDQKARSASKSLVPVALPSEGRPRFSKLQGPFEGLVRRVSSSCSRVGKCDRGKQQTHGIIEDEAVLTGAEWLSKLLACRHRGSGLHPTQPLGNDDKMIMLA